MDISRPDPQYPGDKTRLPPKLAAFSYLLDAQPAPVRDAFSYCLCVLMTQAGVMRLVDKVPGEMGRVCGFEASVGDQFSMVEPKMGKESKAALIDVLREMLEEDGM